LVQRNTNKNNHSNYGKLFFKDIKDPKLSTHLAYQKYLKDYLRCVKGVDDNLGKLFDYLKKEGLWENTVIIYTGDQGMMLGEHDYIDKRWMYDESMRMPFIVYAPTMIELAGGSTPNYMQGKSFINTLRGKQEKDWRKATYYRYWMHIIHHYVPVRKTLSPKRRV